MKKALIIVLALIMVFASVANTYAMTIDELIDGVNNYETLKEYAEAGSVWKASRSEQGMDIDIDVESQNEHYDLDFVLEGTVLTIQASGDNAFTAAFGISFITDIVETALGYEPNEYTKMMNAGDISNFTIENDGIEMKYTEDGGFIFKIDLEKKATAIDLSNIYLTKEELEAYGTFDGEGSIQMNRGLVHVYRENWGEGNVVFIGEEGGPTELSYKTLLAVIAIVKGDDVAAAYAAECPDVASLKDGEDFTVKVNEGTETYEFELMLEDGYQYIKFADYDDMAGRTNGDEDVFDDEDLDYEDIEDIEDSSDNKGLIIGGIIAVVVIVAVIVIVSSKKKKNNDQ